MNALFEEHQNILFLFNKYDVKYLLIGGYAVNYYGYTRATGDMDLWIAPNNENKANVIMALSDYGIEDDQLGLLEKEDFSKHIVFSIGEAPIKVDFITIVNIVKFDDAFPKRKIFELDNIKIPIVHYNDLILMKMNTGRTRDKNDLEILQKINRTNDND